MAGPTFVGLIHASRAANRNVHFVLCEALRGNVRFRAPVGKPLEFAREDCEALRNTKGN
jgi:hypothetical protein